NYPAEILDASKIEKFINSLRKRFDYIIFDSPPVLSFTEGIIYAEKVDAIFQIVRSGKSHVSIALNVKDKLSFFQSKILGIVLNDVHVYQDDYYYNYKYYHYYNNNKPDKKSLQQIHIDREQKKEIFADKN
ncbi:MAG: hypothetical protein ABII23_06780, partial [bacterium]